MRISKKKPIVFCICFICLLIPAAWLWGGEENSKPDKHDGLKKTHEAHSKQKSEDSIASSNTSEDEGKKPMIALIIDDLGHNSRSIAEIIGLGIPVTVSVLPFKTYTRTTAQTAHEHGLEVMLHLPMEPHNKNISPGDHPITTSMNNKEIQKWTEASIDEVPHARGVNNHMGSRATEDVRVMNNVFKTIEGHALFSIDSFTSIKSKAHAAAKEAGVPSLYNELFLDRKDSYEEIRDNLLNIDKRDKNGDGVVVTIAHPRANTIRAIKDFIADEKNAGRFIFISGMFHE